ncbi:MAG: YqgE/AlgH family protein, partial [Geminicoccaceae bacterium]
MTALFKRFVILMVVGLLGSPAATAEISVIPNSTSMTGRYLVASPDLNDPSFRQTVIYLVHHDDTGAMGLVINRLMAKGPVGKLFEAFGVEGDSRNPAEIRMHYGGPVDPGSSLVLHRDDYRNETTTTIGSHLAVSSSDNVLADLALDKGP